MPPYTTKRRTTTNLKTKNNQNYQNIKLYGSLTSKELKKKFASRLVGGEEMGRQGRENLWQGSGPERGCSWWTRQSHICVWINPEEQLGRETNCTTQGSIVGK